MGFAMPIDFHLLGRTTPLPASGASTPRTSAPSTPLPERKAPLGSAPKSPLADAMRGKSDAFFDGLSRGIDEHANSFAYKAGSFSAGVKHASDLFSKTVLNLAGVAKDLLQSIGTGVGNLIGAIAGAIGGAGRSIFDVGASAFAASVGAVKDFGRLVNDLFASFRKAPSAQPEAPMDEQTTPAAMTPKEPEWSTPATSPAPATGYSRFQENLSK